MPARVPDLDPGRPAIGENASRLAFQKRQHFRRQRVIAAICVQGHRELPFEGLYDSAHLRRIARTNNM